METLKWKIPKFYDDAIKLLRTFIKTHDPYFADCWFMLGKILSHHERDKFIDETRTTEGLTPCPVAWK